jgi:23S rRNA pseudouridine1911/1915/1917 synthase
MTPEQMQARVLHRDGLMLVIDKPAGLPVHRGPKGGDSLEDFFDALRYGLPRAPALAHRLDRDTSGCLVVARTDAALAALQAQWKARTVEKTYLALCHGVPAREGRLDTPYGRHPRDRTRFTGRAASTRRAITAWTVREPFDGAALVEVRLETGRTHQIRVHLAEAGHPLLGDAVYGGTRREARLPAEHPVRRAAEAIGRQALHASRLGFDHPRTGRRLTFEAPLPPDLSRGLAVLRREAAV